MYDDGGQFVKRETSEHAVLHDLQSLHVSSDLRTFGPILKRLSRPIKTLENLPALAPEVANTPSTCLVTLASKC